MDSRLITLLGNAPNLSGVNPKLVSTTPYAMSETESVLFVDTSGGSVTVTAPQPYRGRTFTVVKFSSDANTISIAPHDSESIQGASGTYAIPNSSGTGNPTFTFVSEGSFWWMLDSSAGAAGAGTLGAFPSYGTDQTVAYSCDFLGIATANIAPFASAVSGTAAALTSVDTEDGRIGIIGINTGTDVNGYGTIYTSDAIIAGGNGELRFRADVRVPTASDGTNTFLVRSGFADAASTGGTPTDGIFFRYTHSENSGNWTCVTRANGVETATDSTIAAAGASIGTLEILCNADASSVTFAFNGTTVATHTDNIPSGSGREFGATTHIVKSAGATSRKIDIDLMQLRLSRTTAL